MLVVTVRALVEHADHAAAHILRHEQSAGCRVDHVTIRIDDTRCIEVLVKILVMDMVVVRPTDVQGIAGPVVGRTVLVPDLVGAVADAFVAIQHMDGTAIAPIIKAGTQNRHIRSPIFANKDITDRFQSGGG